MANKKTNYTIKSKDGKEYERYRITKTMEVYDKKTGQIVVKKKQFIGKNKMDAFQKYEDYKEYVKSIKEELNRSSSEKLAERTFGDSVEAFINNTLLPDSTMKDATKLRYINSYRNIFDGQAILLKTLKNVCGEDLQAVFTSSEYAPSSKAAALKLLRNYYKYAASQLIANDVTQVIVIPQAKKKRQDQSIVVYTENEQDALLSLTPQNHRLRFLIVLAMETGCRIGELLALTYSDITDNGIRINKSLSELAKIKAEGFTKDKYVEIVDTKSIDSVRTMPMTDLIRTELSIHKAWHDEEQRHNKYKSDHVFTTQTGELYFPSNTRVALKRLCEKINRDYNKAEREKAANKESYKDVTLVEFKGWHAFRHTFGSDLAAAGVPIQEVCKLMGHSDIAVTSKYYVNISNEQKKEAMSKREEYRERRRAKPVQNTLYWDEVAK